MRRSAAPSQLNAAKRPRFTVPYKAAINGPVQPAQEQRPLRPLELESKSAASPDEDPPVSVSGVSHSPASDSTSPCPSPSFNQQRGNRTFSPPSFLNKARLSANLTHSSQHSHESGTGSSVAKNSGIHHDQLKKTELDLSPGTDAAETNCSTSKDGQRSPLRPCNFTRNVSSASEVGLAATGISGKPNQSSIPSKKCTTSLPIPRTISLEMTRKDETGPQESSVHCGYFSVVWCKLSKKKHKKWEGDAVLVTQGRQVTLYDMEGKEIGKGSGYKSSELESLVEDETLRVGGKEIQVMSKLSEEKFKSGKCFAGASAPSDFCCPKKSTAGLSKSFTNPLLARSGTETQSCSVSSVSRVQTVVPRFDPTAPNALVMPQPTAAHQWQHNKHQSMVVDVVVDPYLTQHLRPHQRDGVTFLYECVTAMRNYGGTGAILADDMGLGKTLQCIALIWTLLKQGMYGGKPLVKQVLIVTPGSLVKNWSAEFRKWLGPERLQVFAVTPDNKVQDYVKTTVYPVLIISYEMFVRGYDTVKKVPFDLLVCDEGHRLKNTAIKTTSLISSLETRRRIVLSGTPIQNDLQEFFAVVDFCNPGILGSSGAFRRVYEEPILSSRQPGASREQNELGEERAAELSRLTRMFVLRRTQEINNRYLPPKVEVVIFCRPSPLQMWLYREILRSSVVRWCLMGRGFGGGLGASSPHLLAIAALKQVCNHPRLIAPKILKAQQNTSAQSGQDAASAATDGDLLFSGLVGRHQEEIMSETLDLQHSGKLAALAVILANIFLAHPHDKVVLVSNHTKTLDLLQQLCNDSDYKYVRLDGHTPTAHRQQIVTRFNSSYGQERIFLLSSKAGGVGLNLVGASRLILYDIDWNPANDLQAMARVWRDGQKKEVYIYRLLTTGTLEEKVYQRQISKQGLSGTVMDLKASDIQFSKEDLKDLFSFSEGTECDTHALLGCHCGGDGGGKGDADNNLPSVAPIPVRSCQLGAKGTDKKSGNLSMAELMDWHHLKGSSPHIHKSLKLENTEHLVSYLFWHRINTDVQQHKS